MLLGVPSITSDVGGVKNLLEHEVEGFIYQCDAPYMLAYYIKKIFDSDELAKKLSLAAKEKALQLYDGDRNKSRLIQIYESISKNRKNKENK